MAAVASALRALGVQPQQRVGVFGANCPEWMVAMQVRLPFQYNGEQVPCSLCMAYALQAGILSCSGPSEQPRLLRSQQRRRRVYNRCQIGSLWQRSEARANAHTLESLARPNPSVPRFLYGSRAVPLLIKRLPLSRSCRGFEALPCLTRFRVCVTQLLSEASAA